ncbi:Protein halfway [Eumeta japonica]|uniref:Protein halfway n=1 Tax=Eumeta variegata TaxID=151549 RepID=A0A4C1TPT6_EUMVA|nr:Protein halfway [Eumeta japonica]
MKTDITYETSSTLRHPRRLYPSVSHSRVHRVPYYRFPSLIIRFPFAAGQFPKHSSIACLNISNNNLTSNKLQLIGRPFVYLFNLTVLDASANNLTEFLVHNNRKIFIDLSGNNYLPCKHFQRAMESSNSSLVTFLNYNETYCALDLRFNWFKDVQIVQIDHLRVQKELNISCRHIKPAGINCTCVPERLELMGDEVTNLVAVDCSGRKLKEMPTELPPNTVKLNVSYNNAFVMQLEDWHWKFIDEQPILAVRWICPESLAFIDFQGFMMKLEVPELSERFNLTQVQNSSVSQFVARIEPGTLWFEYDVLNHRTTDALMITSLAAVGDDLSYEHLRQLIVDYNDISSIVELEGTKFIDNFMLFSIMHNKLKTIHTYVLSNTFEQTTPYTTFLIAGNYLHCDCNTEKVLKPWLLENFKNIPDFKSLQCEDGMGSVVDLLEFKVCHTPRDWTDYIYYIIGLEVFVLVLLISKVSYDYWVFKTAGYLPWPANKMPRLPCDWLCE